MKYIFIIATICLMFFSISWLFPPEPRCTGVVTGGACSLEDLGYSRPKKIEDTEFNQEKMYYKNLLPLSGNSSSLNYTICNIGNCE